MNIDTFSNINWQHMFGRLQLYYIIAIGEDVYEKYSSKAAKVRERT